MEELAMEENKITAITKERTDMLRKAYKVLSDAF